MTRIERFSDAHRLPCDCFIIVNRRRRPTVLCISTFFVLLSGKAVRRVVVVDVKMLDVHWKDVLTML